MVRALGRLAIGIWGCEPRTTSSYLAGRTELYKARDELFWHPATAVSEDHTGEKFGWNLPRIDPANLLRSFVSSTMLTLLMRSGEDLEEFFPHSDRLAFVADAFLSLVYN